MDCHQKIKLALAADMLLAQQVGVVALLMILLMITVTVNRQRQKRQRLQRHHQVLTYQLIIKLTIKSTTTRCYPIK